MLHWLDENTTIFRPKDTYFTPSTLNMNYRCVNYDLFKVCNINIHLKFRTVRDKFLITDFWKASLNNIQNRFHSVAGFELILARKMTFYVITYYLPSGLFVVVSWISFLVNPECIPGISISIVSTKSIIKSTNLLRGVIKKKTRKKRSGWPLMKILTHFVLYKMAK